MKKLAAYYLLIFWSAFVFKPLTILLANTAAHAWYNQPHINTVHQHNGEDHVHIEIGKAAEKDLPQQKNSTVKTEETNWLSNASAYVITRIENASSPVYYHRFDAGLHFNYPDVPPLPPWPSLPSLFA